MLALGETTALLQSLRGVSDEEAVDELDHALQAAARAIDDDADDELVLAAALHDLGHSPLFEEHAYLHHDAAARNWLTERFGPRVGWLAGAHVVAKRYLMATEAGYDEGLSQTSKHSLTEQGGAGVEAEFTAHPWWSDALRLRRYDDAAKVPGADGVTVEDVLAVAKRVLRERETT